MQFTPEILALLFGVAAIAGCIDTIAGGGGLITMPVMLWIGVPPAAMLGTNKLQASGGSLTAAIYFTRKGLADPRALKWALPMTFFGSLLGGWAVLQIDPSALRVLLPILMIAIGVYFLLTPGIGEIDRVPRISLGVFACTAAVGLGFYDGFFGPGTGSLLALAFVSLLGFNLGKATAHAKLLNFTSNFAALILFAAMGQVYWTAGLVMLAGQVLGGYVGAHLVVRSGQRLVRWVIVVVCFAMSAKLISASLQG